MKVSKKFIFSVTKHTRFGPRSCLSVTDSNPLLQGGNDYEIFTDPRTIGHSVADPQDTIKMLKELFLK